MNKTFFIFLALTTIPTLGSIEKKQVTSKTKAIAQQKKHFTLPALPYAYTALEPYVDARTMEIHHTKHHQKYVDELNNALKKYPELQKKSLTALLQDLESVPVSIRTSVRNNGGGHANHSLFWKVMRPKGGGTPQGVLKKAIINTFSSFDNFKKLFNDAAKTQFGSGWAWLCLDSKGKLVVTATANQDTPLSQGLIPLLCLDVWEHAYYLNYQNRRPDYIEAWWHVVHWPYVEKRYQDALKATVKN
ncbi:superoxide dismutase [Candidatus Dependentiae bacterium]|nr:superoxide dismutase [Candidatus Dependentiae bacterium]